MAFKVQRVSKVKAPPTLPGSSNTTARRLNDEKDSPSRLKGSTGKPKLPDKPQADVIHGKSTAGSDHNQNKQVNLYAYAGVEFRPLHVTDEGGFATAVIEGRKSGTAKPVDVPQNEVLAYEEVTVPSGNFDKINPENILVKCHDSIGSNNAFAAFTADMQLSTHKGLPDSYEDVENNSHQVSRKKPPPMPKPYAKAKDNVDVPDGGKKKPPPIPKPYSAHKEDYEETSEVPAEPTMDAVYAVVSKPSKKQNLVDLSEPQVKEEEAPPPLPSRPNFEAEEDVRKSQEELVKEEPQPEKTSKGSSIIKTIKKHIRQKSDGGQAKKNTDETKDSEIKMSASSEASSDGNTTNSVQAYLVTDIVSAPSTKMFGEPEMYDSASETRGEENVSKGSTDLPDGWQEVKDSGGTYYWHVASGTTQWEKPKKLESVADSSSQHKAVDKVKPKPKPELKTVTSFPVHSMGWLELEESQVAPHNMSDTIAECISNLARERKDLWKTAETWGGGKDLRLLLESDNLKLVDNQTKATLLVQPISKMRVWGAGREEQKDFAYVARDQATGKHKCHVFRCHGNISGRAIHNKLHEMCNKILAEKKKARENQQQNSSTKQWSDILNTPPKSSVKDQAGFNVKPVTESKKSFSGKFIGKVEVPRPTGIDVVHKAIDVAITSRDPQTWRTCLIEITVSSVRSTDCVSQQVIAENRIKFVSFIGVAKDVRFCGYISSGDQTSPFLCHVFQCTPNAASFTKALEEACRLRLQSCLDTNPELAKKLIATEAEKCADKDTNKAGAGIKGFLGKLANQAKLAGPRKSSPEPFVSNATEQLPSSTEFLIKYYGHQPVSVGTGPTAIREAVRVAQGTTLQICTINITPDFITLDGSIRSGISRKHIPLERISYCGLASDHVHFGLIESQGGGKFICHVFAEYKMPVNKVVEAINKVL